MRSRQHSLWGSVSLARNGAGIFYFALMMCVQVWAQALPGVAPATQPVVRKDALGRTTPRGTVLGFLSAARKGDDELAAQYLNTRANDGAAEILAHQLFVVLDRRLPARLNQISNEPEGSVADLLRPDQDLVGTISGDQGDLDILVERVDRGKSGPLWLFSSKTLADIPALYEEINLLPVDNVVPQVLVNNRLLGIAWFEWLAVLVGIPLFFLLAAFVNRLLSRIVGDVRRRRYKNTELRDPEVFLKPLRLLLLALVIEWTLSKLSLALMARQIWSGAAGVITVAACVWLVILAISAGERHLQQRLRQRNLAGATSVLRLVRGVVDVLVIFAGVMVMLHHFGVNPTAALAGLGVGGIAVALAAQKTLENVIGGVSLIMDRAIRVGEVLKVGELQGTVEDIGLRSTRIRTLERTVVNLPNGQVATMNLENLSSRDKFWFHQILRLRHGTTAAQMHEVLEGIRGIVRESRLVEQKSIRVRLLRFGLTALEVEVYAYVLVPVQNQFLEIQEGLLLRIMECIQLAGVQIALPSQAIVVSDVADAAAVDLETQAKRSSGDAAALE